MTVLTDTENWVTAFSRDIGVRPTNTVLLDSASRILTEQYGTSLSLGQLIEFSFATAGRSSSQKLRYVVDVTGMSNEHVESIISLGIRQIRYVPAEEGRSPVYQRLDCVYDETDGHLLYGIGAEHDPDDGSISSFKTYWRFKSPTEELKSLMSNDERKILAELTEAIYAFWPSWNHPRLVGIDYLRTGENRFKLYLPQKSFGEPLSIVAFCEFLLRLGWQVDLETFPKLSHFILQHQLDVEPTAYSLGFAIGSRPSIKLEIATKAYFDDTENALRAVFGLAKSLGLDPSPIQTGIVALAKHTPLARSPIAEVICLDFYPEGSNRLILYCSP